MKIRKDKIIKEDGRYLIFYEFETKDGEINAPKDRQSETLKPKSQERTTKHV